MLTENYLVTDYGFKRRTRNKKKSLFNQEYDVTLTKTSNGGFRHQEEKIVYHEIGDIIRLFAIKEIERGSERFRKGLPEQNLKQGGFDATYKENTQGDGLAFIPHNKVKLLLRAKYNELISSALMGNGSGPVWTYNIIETKYYFTETDSSSDNIITLTLAYHYKDRFGHHDFWNIFDVYNFSKDDFPINQRVGAYIPIDFLIEKFG